MNPITPEYARRDVNRIAGDLIEDISSEGFLWERGTPLQEKIAMFKNWAQRFREVAERIYELAPEKRKALVPRYERLLVEGAHLGEAVRDALEILRTLRSSFR